MNEIEKRLKRKVLQHVRRLGYSLGKDGKIFLENNDLKETIRRVHALHGAERLSLEVDFISAKASQLSNHFANGEEIDLKRIQPVLEEVVSGQQTGDLFRLASLLWSV